MSPYTIFPSYNFFEKVYKDGFRIIVYKVLNNFDSTISRNLFPYELSYEDDTFVKFRTTQNPANYVLYYDKKYLNDSSHVLKKNKTFRNNYTKVKCNVLDFNSDEIKLKLLDINNIKLYESGYDLDDLCIGLYFDRDNDNVRYDLFAYGPNGIPAKAEKSIYSKIESTEYMTKTIRDKLIVSLNCVDSYECSKSKMNPDKYYKLKRAINRLSENGEVLEQFCDNKRGFATLLDYDIPLDFVYKACTTENMVFMVEDLYRSYLSGMIYGPIYKSSND